MTTMRRRAAYAAVPTLALALLSACTPTVPMSPAPHATEIACADVIVRVPDAIGDLERRNTDAQGTAAWGIRGEASSAVLLRCGVEPLGPTTLPCFTVRSIDWVRDDSDEPVFVFTTYGRTPAVEVIVDAEQASGTEALVELNNAVGTIAPERFCTAPDEVL